jgi:type I restriction enzyme M protein
VRLAVGRHTVRHDGIGYAFYVEQLTYLLFLKMAEEKGVDLPKKCNWNTLAELSGTELIDGYTDILRALGKTQGILGDIFANAQNRFSKAVNLKKLISLIGEVEIVRCMKHSQGARLGGIQTGQGQWRCSRCRHGVNRDVRGQAQRQPV